MADGHLSPKEVQNCLDGFGYKLSPQEAQAFLQRIDRNHNGIVSFEAFRDGVREYVTTAHKAGKADKHKDKKEKHKDDKKHKKH